VTRIHHEYLNKLLVFAKKYAMKPIYVYQDGAYTSKVASKPFASIEEKNKFEKRKAEELCVWVNAHLDEPIELKDLVEASGLNHFEILRIFSIYFRTTPMQWIRQQRELHGQGKTYFELNQPTQADNKSSLHIPSNLRKK
jgi:hypothetical protein